ncbi:MAG: rhamnogalacturonan acetylesterase [Duncaniella sp.]|nr:rhamnogalacturonan acetylesterase [Duncaniella sp.]
MLTVGDYTDERGYGWDFGTSPDSRNPRPFMFSTRVPRDGNYRVTVTLGDRRHAGSTTVRAESRRLMAENVVTRKGEKKNVSFNVAKRNPQINTSSRVKINPRERGTTTWDDKITLEFTGKAPVVERVVIEPIEDTDSVVTLFLCGNSTVVDQTYEPWASWGQIVPRYLDSAIVVANHAESGESAQSFIDKKRLDKVLSMARKGDYMIIEFGHNDQKQRSPGSGAWYNFSTNLKIFIDRARRAGVTPIFVTPACRRSFDAEGKVRDTHLDYPDAMKAVAEREGVTVIDLNTMTKSLYEALGTEGSKKAFVHYPAGTFQGQTTPLEDNTHFNPYGATQIAKCVLEALKTAVPAIGDHIIDLHDYDPAHPDDPDSFYWPEAIFIQLDRPYGS